MLVADYDNYERLKKWLPMPLFARNAGHRCQSMQGVGGQGNSAKTAQHITDGQSGASSLADTTASESPT
jgi:hypothetical protein